MANATVSRLGQIEAAGDVQALFLKQFAGEVLTNFDQTVVLKEKTRQRVITSGKSASFPAIFSASAAYHTPGVELVGQVIEHNEVVVTIDDVLIADAFISNIDEAMNHYDVRAPYSKELGFALALAYDKNVARNIVRAARGAALFTGDTGGQSVTDADGASNAVSLAGSLWSSKQLMEEANVDVESTDVFAALKPAQWYLLAQEPTVVLNKDVGGDGSYSKGTFELIGGVKCVKSNALPWGVDDSANTAIPTAYRISMANTIAAVFTESAAATVQLMGLGMETSRDVRRQGELMLAKYAVGHGPLRAKCAVEIKSA